MEPAKTIKLRATWTFETAEDLNSIPSPMLEADMVAYVSNEINKYRDERYRVLHVISEYVLGKNDNTRNNKVSI